MSLVTISLVFVATVDDDSDAIDEATQALHQHIVDIVETGTLAGYTDVDPAEPEEEVYLPEEVVTTVQEMPHRYPHLALLTEAA